MNKLELSYIGFSVELIYHLMESDRYDLKSVVYQQGRISNELCEELNRRKIKTHEFASKKDFEKLASWIVGENVLMFKFGYILPESITSKFNIFNIHLGDLRTNRGAHSLNWSILLGEKTTYLSLYKIDDRVDLGLLLNAYEVPVLDTDDTNTLEKRLISRMNDLTEDLYKYLTGSLKGMSINHGIYRPKIENKDYTINIAEDSIETIRCKIQSQKAYKGAIIEIDNYRFYVSEVEKVDNLNN